MPRAAGPKCPRRSTPVEALDELHELALVWGHVFGIREFEVLLQSRQDYARAWARWGDELTAKWIAAYPGSRPMAAYLLGDIEPPAWQHEVPALRHPVRLGGHIVLADRAWHMREIEAEHLAEIGEIDDDEYAAALERLAGPSPVCSHRYRTMAADLEDGRQRPAPPPPAEGL